MGCTSEQSNTRIKDPVANDYNQELEALLMNDDGVSNLLELHLECKNLKNVDTFSKSDPLVVAYILNRNK